MTTDAGTRVFFAELVNDGGDVPTGVWQRREVEVTIPPNTTEDIEVRLYSPGGSIWWDEVTSLSQLGVAIGAVYAVPGMKAAIEAAVAAERARIADGLIDEMGRLPSLPAWPPLRFHARRWRRRTYAGNSDAMRLDASRAEADAELAEWRALLDAAKGRRG